MAMVPRLATFIPGWWRARHWAHLLLADIGGIAPGNNAVSRAAAGDVAAFEEFVERYQRLVLNYLWRMTGEEQSAYDLTQETFLRAWENYPKIRVYENQRAWLLRVATNLALTFRTRRAAPVGAAMPLDDLNEPAMSDPARRVIESEMVRLALHALTPRARALLVLREIYGLGLDDIMGILGMSRDAVKMALCRAREQFRTVYEREEQQS
jgi:RNA polymerase sigma-70 factor, ECF subfamily